MDATHLAEFFQVEGVVADYDITLGNLIGQSWSPPSHYPKGLFPMLKWGKKQRLTILAFMKEFFAKTGNTKLKFKPAFNPYTEVRCHLPS